MKGEVLADARIQGKLKEFVFAELFTDRHTPEDDENNRLMLERYGSALPLYCVVDADGRVLAKLSGTSTVDGFLKFLEQGLAAYNR